MADDIYGGPSRPRKRVSQMKTQLQSVFPTQTPAHSIGLLSTPLHVSQLACALALQAILAERSPLSRAEIAASIPTLSDPDRLISELIAGGVLRLTPDGRSVEHVPD